MKKSAKWNRFIIAGFCLAAIRTREQYIFFLAFFPCINSKVTRFFDLPATEF